MQKFCHNVVVGGCLTVGAGILSLAGMAIAAEVFGVGPMAPMTADQYEARMKTLQDAAYRRLAEERGETAAREIAPAPREVAQPEVVVADFRDKWNEAATGLEFGTGAVGGREDRWDLAWRGRAMPHPTYRGGSKAAYQAAGKVLVRLCDRHQKWVRANVHTRHQLTESLEIPGTSAQYGQGSLWDLYLAVQAMGGFASPEDAEFVRSVMRSRD